MTTHKTGTREQWLDRSQRAFIVVSTLLFIISVVVTIGWSTSMSTMGHMTMPGGWTMSMAWMRMPGQTWTATALSFFGMWIAMMVAMMLPSLIPMLRRYRDAVRGASGPRLALLTIIAGTGYFFVWTVAGLAVYPLGVALAAIEMQQSTLSRAVPIVAAAVVLLAGALQFTAWKTRLLACCREGADPRSELPSNAGAAWRHGVRLGRDCGPCCANLMVILLVLGVMDLLVMAVVTGAITLERLAPAGVSVARAIGLAVVAMGLFLAARATGLA